MKDPANPQPLFVGVDVGSGSVRAAVFDASGERRGHAVRPLKVFRNGPAIVQQSSADIWKQVCGAVRDALAPCGPAAASVMGIGFDATCSLVAVGADGGGVSVSPDGQPQLDVVMWMDHRAADEAAEINRTGDRSLAHVGGAVSLEMQLPKLLWLKRHLPQRWAATRRFFDLADYLVWRSTGADVASVCTLTCKWNYLAHEKRHPAAMLAAVGLQDLGERMPAEVRGLGTAAGALHEGAARAMGLRQGIAVAVGIIDAHAGGLAVVASRPEGHVAIITGTSNCHMATSGEPAFVPGVWGPYWDAMLPARWLNEGGQSAAGALIDWTLQQHAAWAPLQDQAAREGREVWSVLDDAVRELLAREPQPTTHLHVLPDHHGNRSPRADPRARGAAVGLTLETGRVALARLYLATLQALAYGTRHIVEQMNANGHRIDRVTMCGGGVRNALLVRQQADALGLDVHLAAEEETMALGAALLAATASGAFTDLQQAAASMVRTGATVTADPAQRAFHDAKYRVFLQLQADEARWRALMET